MAIRSTDKIPEIRCTLRGRVLEIQGFNDQEIQTLKASIASIREALDTNWDTSTERARRLIRTDIHLRLGSFLGEIHHSLSEHIFSKIWLQRLRLEAEPRSIPKSHRKGKPPRTPAKRRGLPKDARASVYQYERGSSSRRNENLPGRRR